MEFEKRPPPNCPNCGKPMHKNDYNTYECKNIECKDRFIAIPLSIIGIHKP